MTKRKTLFLWAMGMLLAATASRAEGQSQWAIAFPDSGRVDTGTFTLILPAPFGLMSSVWGGRLVFPAPSLSPQSALPAIAANGPALYGLFSSLPPREAVFSGYLQRLAKDYESQHILYRSIPLSDCSGMFHRLLQQMKEAFPAFVFPEVAEARSSRALAQWYYDRGSLHIVEDAAASGQLIKPGAIMFFGQVGKKYSQPTIEQLTTYGVGIMHIGTVVDVEKDEQGNVMAYTMFHARGRGKPASHTRHYLRRPQPSGLPAFGNWRQQWVAVAYMDTQY